VEANSYARYKTEVNSSLLRLQVSTKKCVTQRSEIVRVRYVIAIFATSVAVQVGPAFGQTLTKNTEYMVDASIRKLLRQMDRDKNGTVSKDEFLRHFSERFDRLDVNHDRRLVSDELRPMLIPNAKEKNSAPKVF